MLPKLKVGFTDFWYGLDPEKNFFTDVLRTRFTVEISRSPDVIFCSTFGNDWRNYSCKRIFVTGENIAPDDRYFDASFSFEPTKGSNYYLPLYRVYGSYPAVFRERKLTEASWQAKGSVGTVFSNVQAKFRTWVFHELSRSVGVASGGRAFNNVGGPVQSKTDFLSHYRFSMAFENTRWPGYTTEKLIESYASDTVPLYWGDPLVNQHFNPKAFLQIEEKEKFPLFLKELQRVVGDYEAYRELYEEPLFPENREPEFLKVENIANFLEPQVTGGNVRTGKEPVSEYQLYRWSRRWRFKEWDYKKKPLIQLLEPFSLFGFLSSRLKLLVKTLLRKPA